MARSLLVVVLAVSACAASPSSEPALTPSPPARPTTAPAPPRVTQPSTARLVQSEEAAGGRRLFVALEGCVIGITIYDDAGTNRKNAALDRDCELEGLRGAFGAIVARIADDRGSGLPFRALSFGRTGAPSLPRLGLRLAALMFASPRWDPQRGAPHGTIGPHQLLQETITAEALVPEAEAVLREHGHCLTAPSVEQIDVRRVADLPSPEVLTGLGASPNDRVPFDASLWFKVGDVDADGACRRAPPP